MLVEQSLHSLDVPLPGLVVEENATGDGQGPDAAPKGHRVTKKQNRQPDQERSLHRVGHTDRKKRAKTKITSDKFINLINPQSEIKVRSRFPGKMDRN